MQAFKIALMFAVVFVSGLGATARADYWTPYVSEENGGPESVCTSFSHGAVGASCRGPYCDEVRLRCQTLPAGAILDSSTDYWSHELDGWFSEESSGIGSVSSLGWYPYSGSNYHVCNGKQYSAGIVNGIRCKGSYCDQISLECDVPVKYINGKKWLVAPTDCGWTSSWYSEEQGSIYFGANRFITGVQCRGSYCDQKRYYVCTIDGTKLVDPATTPRL